MRVGGGGDISTGNQLRPHARNMLIGIQDRAVSASHIVLTALLSVAALPGTTAAETNGPSAQNNYSRILYIDLTKSKYAHMRHML